ncbi:hypothetical protein [Thalassorhabdomicrobium marinisediminis]|uniref:Phage tail assembly chaperone n=1 Tax=Thalassorhabdomicrobium marinisediminis TaxID=2170577 RepID=A0A2T7FVD0_9RHOB|nr:hypothetical protein [Thalassorhabdomicrobium marinisediminis]PVA06117.1 hypothetical protein DC363_12460 [Thalassorhabdomicrobium marinisediminis]
MIKPHAYDTFTLSYGGNTVALRPSLRAATHLEQLHTGFPNLLKKVAEGDTATLREIITSAATDRTAAHNILSAMAGAKLKNVQKAAIKAAYAVIQAILTPNPDIAEKPTEATAPAKPVEWADLFNDLYRIATGWLGWPPETAWAATIPEITEAFEGHTAKLKAIHGG